MTGILAAATPDAGDLSIALRASKSDAAAAIVAAPPPKPALVLNGKDLVQLEAQDTDLDFAALPQRPQSSASNTAAAATTDSFRTDTDISRASQLGKERQLQAWGADAGYGSGGIEDGGGLEDGLGRSINGNGSGGKGNTGRKGGPASSSNGGAWDQFAANERAFGLRTDYDDEIYTTRLDRSTSDFKQREARAAQLEREILKGSSNSSASLAYNAHVAEERGEQVADSLDEEERYGAVIRTGTEGAYVPPGARKAALARLQQQQNGGPGQGSPGGAGSGSSGTASPAPPPPVSSLSASTPAAAAPVAPTTSTTTTTTTTSSTKPNPNAKPYDRSMQEFVHSERVRLEQRRAQMQQAQQQSQQQAQLKKEHDSKLASLVQWSQTFKNPYPMPDEVAQILGKKPAAAAAAGAANGGGGGGPATADSKTAAKSATVSPATATSALPATSAATVASPRATAAATGKPTAPPPTTTTKITKAMVLEIPPFDPNRAKAKQAALLAAQKAGTAPAPAVATAPVPAMSASGTAETSAPSTAAPGAKPPAGGAKKLSATSAAFVFKPNPAAASFTPGASNTSTNTNNTTATGAAAAAAARRPSATSTTASAAESAPPPPPPPKVPVNPFFGTKQIKKGSSSMHVKEDFTPFKNGVPPEPATVPPAWPFTGKPYRSIYPIPPQGPSLHDDAAASGMIDPNNAAAIAAAQQQQQAHAHAFIGAAGGMPINMLSGPQHPSMPPQQPPPPPPFVAMSSAGGSISGSPAPLPMPPPPPPQQAIAGSGGGPAHLQHPHPHQQPQQFGMYGGGNGGHAPPPLAPPHHHHHHQFAQQQQQQQQFSPATAAVAMGYARQPGGGGPAPPPPQQQQQQQQMAHMNAPGPGPQFQPHHPPPPPPFFGQPGAGGGGGGPPGGGGGGGSHMPGFVSGPNQGHPPYGAQSEYRPFSESTSRFGTLSSAADCPSCMVSLCFCLTVLSSPHMPHAAVHSPRMSVSTQGGRGPPQQQPPMPWTPPPPPPFQQSATPIPSERDLPFLAPSWR